MAAVEELCSRKIYSSHCGGAMMGLEGRDLMGQLHSVPVACSSVVVVASELAMDDDDDLAVVECYDDDFQNLRSDRPADIHC